MHWDFALLLTCLFDATGTLHSCSHVSLMPQVSTEVDARLSFDTQKTVDKVTHTGSDPHMLVQSSNLQFGSKSKCSPMYCAGPHTCGQVLTEGNRHKPHLHQGEQSTWTYLRRMWRALLPCETGFEEHSLVYVNDSSTYIVTSHVAKAWRCLKGTATYRRRIARMYHQPDVWKAVLSNSPITALLLCSF